MPFCPVNKKRERPRGKAAEEVELETDDESNNPMSLQMKSPLQLQPQRDGLLHPLIHLLSVVFLRESGNGSPTFAS